jgi:hypothetical protein
LTVPLALLAAQMIFADMLYAISAFPPPLYALEPAPPRSTSLNAHSRAFDRTYPTQDQSLRTVLAEQGSGEGQP